MWSRKLLYMLSLTCGVLAGGAFGLAASGWGGIEVILPLCLVVGALLGYAIGYLIDLFTR